MSIGSRIKELRTKKNITQEELARQIGVSKGAIANYENEISSPKIDLMYKLFDALGCDANYLHQDDMKRSVYKDAASPEEFEQLIKKYRILDDHGRDMVDTVLQKEFDRCETVPKVIKMEKAYLEPKAANERVDIEVTEEMRQHDDDIMEDDKFWK